jgi:hypothetical protein
MPKIGEQELDSAIKLLDEAGLLPEGATIAKLDKACQSWLSTFHTKETPTQEETKAAVLLSLLGKHLKKVTR